MVFRDFLFDARFFALDNDGLRQTCLMVKDVAYSKIMRTLKRANIRSALGNAWESAKDVCYHWALICALSKPKISVWHAADDNLNPPEQGEWLAKYFEEKDAANFRTIIKGSAITPSAVVSFYNLNTACSKPFRRS